MHCPKAFEESTPETLLALIRQYPLATVISHADTGLEVNLLPMLVQQRDGQSYLLGRMAKNNAQLQALAHSKEVVWVFQGPNAYVSPAWYPSKQAHGKVVPTWNYIMIEVRGKVRLFEDADALLHVVTALTQEHERGSEQPWQVSDAPSAYVAGQLRGIVGMFWFGAQTYFASTAVALALHALIPGASLATVLSLTWIDWLSKKIDDWNK